MERARRFGSKAAWFAFCALMALGIWEIATASLYYLEDGTAHPFFLEKLPLTFETAFTIALAIHIPSALFALPACRLLALKTTQKHLPRGHRWLGRVTGVVVLFGVVPSGIWLAFTAKGGALGTVGFLLTALITGAAMVESVRTARRKDFVTHRRMSSHVLGQLSVAVTSRVLLVVADAYALDPEAAYVAALFIPVLLSVVVVEWRTRPRRARATTSPGVPHEARAALAPL